MTEQQRFDEWLSECPVDYYEVFGKNTYMFMVNRFEDKDNDGDELV